mgnify:CR=1 FL=1
MLTIGEAMKKARLEKGFTQVQLSVKSGISIPSITAWENGKVFPTIINLIPIADALNISLDELVGRTVAK